MAAEFAPSVLGIVQNSLSTLSNAVQTVVGAQSQYLLYGGLALVAAWKIKDYGEYLQLALVVFGAYLIGVALGWIK